MKGTNGGAEGASGASGSSGLGTASLTGLLLGGVLLFGLVRITANVASYLADRRAAGSDVTAATAWLYEGTSLAAWAMMLVPCWFAIRAIRPPQFRWPAAVALHAALILPITLGHVGVMVALRVLVWWLGGDSYTFTSSDGAPILYELRKNIATYVELMFILFLIQWLVARHAASRQDKPAKEAPLMLAVEAGAVTRRLPVFEIEHISAAGNYVEIAWRDQSLLHRATLSAIETALASAGFVRIHRSRLVRKGAIRRIITLRSGDFDVEMESGALLRGSRRYRGNIAE